MKIKNRTRKLAKARIVSTIGFVIALVLTASHAASAQFLHPKIAAKQTTIRNVVVLPAKVEVVKDSMKGPEGMAAESEMLSARVAQLIKDALAAKQISTLTGPVSAAGEGDAEQKYTVADVQSRYDELAPKIAKKRKDVKKGRFTMGDEVLNLNLDKNADAIVFVRGRGQQLTSGKKAFSWIVPTLPAHLILTIGIVDARSGEVLLYADAIYVGDPITAKDQSLLKPIVKSLKKLPAPS